MVKRKGQFHAGWAKSEITPLARYPMAGYLARKGDSQGTLDPLFVRALVLREGDWRACIAVADLLLISSAWGTRLRKRIARAIGMPARNVVVAATHTHSGPLVDTAPFRLSRNDTSERVRESMREIEEMFIQTAIAAHKKLQPVRTSYSRTQIHGLATDRNVAEKNRVQTFLLLRLEAGGSSAVFGVLPCHPTLLGAANLLYSGDLHGEIARRYERRVEVALIANGACANVSTRFTRRSQTRSQLSRFASLVMRQAESRPFRPFAPEALSIASEEVRLPIKNFQPHGSSEDASLTGRLADVAREGRLVAAQLSKAPEFRHGDISITITLIRLGPVLFAAFPVELYAETGRFLWSRANVTALCYANGYWGYVSIPGASEPDYEVTSSPFTAAADKLLRAAALRLAAKL